MKHFAKALVSCLLVLALCLGFPLPARADWVPPFEVPADEGLLVELNTGEVLWEHNADEPHAIASLTKMVTGLLLIESGEDLDTVITVPDRLAGELQTIKDWDGAYLDLQPGEEISLRNLLLTMLLPSTNDTASVIADYLSGGDIPAFVERMTRRAAEMGCENTRFSCPHGLYDEGNRSTARDIARIAAACMQNETFAQVVTTESYWLPKSNVHTQVQTPDAPEGMYLKLGSTIQLQNPESPLYRPYARGIKTGFTDAAGRCIATLAHTEEGDFLLVLLGVPNQKDADGQFLHYVYAQQLLDWATLAFRVADVPGEDVLTSLPIDYCREADSVPLRAAEPLPGRLLEQDTPLRYEYELPQRLTAGISDGEIVGSARVYQGERLLGSVDLAVDGDYRYSALLYLPVWLEAHKGLLVGAAGILLGLALARHAARTKRRSLRR